MLTRITRRLSLCLLLGLSVLLTACSSTQDSGGKAAVATANPLATQAAFRILDRGGNAFDAAITAAATLGVVEPYGSGLGGGGFWLLQKSNGETVFIDAREKAPLAATSTMYLDAQGKVIPGASINGPLAAGIPGQAAAFDHIAQHYGRLPLSATLEDAIQLASDGFRVYRKYLDMVHFRMDELKKHSESTAVFLENQSLPTRGFIVRQPALANTLKLLAAKGRAGFYEGTIAEHLVHEVRSAGGIWQLEDLLQYQVKERPAIQFRYQNASITSAPPPSSGGIALAQMLGILNYMDTSDFSAAQTVMARVAAMDVAYRNRAAYLGDPDFVQVPVEDIINPNYLALLAKSIEDNVRNTDDIADWSKWEEPVINTQGEPDANEQHHTTHISIIDKYGNRASVTLSINLPFGSGFVSPSTGVLLNNEMDDFSIKPGQPNQYGLTGNEQNEIAPGKRPLSSMTPTLVETDDMIASLGTPGGSRIITMVMQGVLGLVGGMDPEQVVAMPRYHYQYQPDYIQYEKGALSSEVIASLRRLGHAFVELDHTYGNMQISVLNKKTGEVKAASDRRGVGQAIVRN